MSTLLYLVRKDWQEKTVQIEQDWHHLRLVIFCVAIAVGPGVFLVDRLVDAVAWRSFLSEALSLCLYLAVAVWYGLWRRGRLAWLVALVTYGVALAIMGLVDASTKGGLDTLLVDSPRADEPILLVGVVMLAFLPLAFWMARRYPVEMSRIGLDVSPLVQSLTAAYSSLRQRLIKFIGAGLGVGVIIGLHFWLTTKTVGMDLDVKPWPYIVWQFCYEIGPQSLPEELFMRGVVFNTLYFGRSWNFWLAALAASSLELLSLLVKQDYSQDVLILLGVVFYTVVSSVASAGLFRWSRSVTPGYVNNVVFGLVSLFR